MLVVTKAEITLSQVLNAFTKCTIFLTAPEPQTDTEMWRFLSFWYKATVEEGFHFSLEHLPSYKISTVLI